MYGCLAHAPYWGPCPQPRHVPWLGIEPETLLFRGRHSIHWATSARAGCRSFEEEARRKLSLLLGPAFVLSPRRCWVWFQWGQPTVPGAGLAPQSQRPDSISTAEPPHPSAYKDLLPAPHRAECSLLICSGNWQKCCKLVCSSQSKHSLQIKHEEAK